MWDQKRPGVRRLAARPLPSGNSEMRCNVPAGLHCTASCCASDVVDKTSEGGFTMREIRDGRLGDTITLYVREPDRPYIDIAHAQTHAALGQPIRVYTQEIEGRRSVVYMEDAPLLQ